VTKSKSIPVRTSTVTALSKLSVTWADLLKVRPNAIMSLMHKA